MRKTSIRTSSSALQKDSSIIDTAQEVMRTLRKQADSQKVSSVARFFKVQKGEYGYGDVFIGITVPEIRKVALRYQQLPLTEIQVLLTNSIHEFRLCALHILGYQVQSLYKNTRALYSEKDIKRQHRELYSFYLKHMQYVNNWDLVDSSAYQIVGSYLYTHENHPAATLQKLAVSSSIWERRIAIISTWYAIRLGKCDDTLLIAQLLLNDTEDLIHKAVGWMLREVGKKNETVLIDFLQRTHRSMPRTMLRYAIERFPEKQRNVYLFAR